MSIFIRMLVLAARALEVAQNTPRSSATPAVHLEYHIPVTDSHRKTNRKKRRLYTLTHIHRHRHRERGGERERERERERE